ncbi:MAG: hypothetical protein ACF8PN_16480 [Phycisphaerales bacterium]
MRPAVNLIPIERRREKARRVRAGLWTGVTLVYGAVLIGVFTVARSRWGADPGRIDAEIQRLSVQSTASNEQIKSSKSELESLQRTIGAMRAVGDQPDWSALLGFVSRMAGSEIVLREVSLVLDPSRDVQGPGAFAALPANSLAMQGFGRTQPDVNQFILKLEQAGFFRRVRLTETNRQPFLAGFAFQFKAVCNLPVDEPPAGDDS